MRTLFVIAGLAACGSNNNAPADAPKLIDAAPDAKVFMDAPPSMFNFACVGDSAPTSVAANVTISGTVEEVAVNNITPSIGAKVGAKVDACVNGAPNCTTTNHLGTEATTDSAGAFSIGPLATDSTPLDAFLEMTATGDRPTNVYPASPVAADLSGVPVLTFTTGAFTLVLEVAGATQSDANGTLGLAVVDCQNNPITDTMNITITVEQGGSAVVGAQVYDLGALSSMAAGTFLVFNVPPGATTVSAKYKTTQLLSHVVGTVAATTTETIIRPGY